MNDFELIHDALCNTCQGHDPSPRCQVCQDTVTAKAALARLRSLRNDTLEEVARLVENAESFEFMGRYIRSLKT